MRETHSLYFGPFRLDLGTEQLWRGAEPRPLTRKAFTALAYLVTHAGQLIRKDALVAAVWAVPYVSDMAVAACIREIRRVLDDTAQTPQFLETIRGRGYRFVAAVTAEVTAVQPPDVSIPASAISATPAPVPLPHTAILVGRAVELGQLQQCWARAQRGERQVVFLTGEAGIGKTALMDAFAAQVTARRDIWVGTGQCIDQYGAGEAYLPLLEALGRLGRGPGGGRLGAILHAQAPSWLVHLPALIPTSEVESLHRRSGGATRERMLRELADAVEALTDDAPAILILEDLHWSDSATIEWLAYIARRRGSARLMVLGTYRPIEAMVHTHPVRTVVQELQVHGQAHVIVLTALAVSAVQAYLTQRVGGADVPEGLADVLYRRTTGHPLFLVTLVEALLRQGGLRTSPTGWEMCSSLEAIAAEVPASIRKLIEQQCVQLTPKEQTLLEVAAVAGQEFAAAAVAAGLAGNPEEVETQCAVLASRKQFLRECGVDEWPDGTVATRYGFLHALYQEIVYDRVPTGQRAQWHRQIGLRLEVGYGTRARDIAAELAVHFVQGRDLQRAVYYLAQAGENARQRSALHEAAAHLRRGLDLLTALPESSTRTEHEMTLLLSLGLTLSMMQGQATPEVGQLYDRARLLCEQLDDIPRLFLILMGLRRFYSGRGTLHTALAVAEQLDKLAQRSRDPEHHMEARFALGLVHFCLGNLTLCRRHMGRGLALDVSSSHRTYLTTIHGNRRASCLNYAALASWCLGYPEQALQQSQEAVRLAQQHPVPSNLAFTMHFAACVRQLRRQAEEAERLAATTMALATDDELGHWLGQSTILYGWALAAQGQSEAGLEHLRHGLRAMHATGSELLRPYYLGLLAGIYGALGQPAAAQTTLEDAWVLVHNHDERWYAAELHRLQGVLLLRQASPAVSQAEQCFQQALDLARQQQAKSWELRAAISLAQLWRQQGRQQAARALLAPVYGWFTEGFDTADLQKAQALIEAPGEDSTSNNTIW